MITIETKINQINRLPVPIRRAMCKGLKQRHNVVFNEGTKKIEAAGEVIIEAETPKKKKKAKKKAE